MQFDFDYTVAAAVFATSAVDVERESACRISPCFRVGKRGKKFSYIAENSRVRCRVGARSSADWALVYANDLIDVFDAFDRIEIAERISRAHKRV